MNKEEFIKLIITHVRNSAVRCNFETISDPPGRKPSKRLLNISKWFVSLSEDDKAMVIKTAEMTLDQGLFNFLCILDGVNKLDLHGGDGEYILSYKTRDRETIINDKHIDLEELHDIYNSLTLSED